jgi:ATP-dependent Lhr-like helicase
VAARTHRVHAPQRAARPRRDAAAARQYASFAARSLGARGAAAAPRPSLPSRRWLDQATLSGEFVWLRLWGPWRGPLSKLCDQPRAARRSCRCGSNCRSNARQPIDLGAAARTLHDVLQQRGASFPTDLQSLSAAAAEPASSRVSANWSGSGSPPATRSRRCASWRSRRAARAFPLYAVGRWSLLPLPPAGTRASEAAIELCAAALLRRLGVLSHAALLADRFPVPWRLLLRALRGLELRGEVRGGRFVTGLAGEQYALATAVAPLRGAAKAHALQAQ